MFPRRKTDLPMSHCAQGRLVGKQAGRSGAPIDGWQVGTVHVNKIKDATCMQSDKKTI